MIPLLIIYGALGVLWLASHVWGTILLILVTLYLIDCTFRPRILCRVCSGSGTVMKSGRRLALCPLCKGRKQHTRLGARVWHRHRFMFHDDPEAEVEEAEEPTRHDRGWW